MAKKKKIDKAEAAEHPVDAEAAIDADAAGDDEAPVVPASASAPEPPDYDRVAAKLWPVEDDHGSVTRMLTQAAEREVDLAEAADEANRSGSNTLNLILLVLIIAATGVGIWQFRRVSAPETLAAKAAEREALEQQHLSEQLAKQKKYGVLRIESEPPQAVVIKDGEKLVAEVAAAVAPPPAEGAPAAGAEGTPAVGTPAATPAAGGDKPATPPAAGSEGAPAAGAEGAPATKQLVGMTPMNIMNLDISQQYTIRLEKEGYEPFEFSVAEHLWVKDPTTSEYKFFKAAELTPINCEYYFLYDAKKRREVQFKDKAECLTHYDEAVNQQVSVTECVCKIPPEGVGGEKKDP